MGVLLKCLLGVFGIFCLMQFVKMDDARSQADLQKSIMETLLEFPTPSPKDVGKFTGKLTETFLEAMKQNLGQHH